MRNDVPSVITFYDVRAKNLDHCLVESSSEFAFMKNGFVLINLANGDAQGDAMLGPVEIFGNVTQYNSTS